MVPPPRMAARVPPYTREWTLVEPFACDRSAPLPARSVVEDEEGRVSVDRRGPRPGKRARARLTAISCDFCGREFTPTRGWQRCCSGRCRAAWSRERIRGPVDPLLNVGPTLLRSATRPGQRPSCRPAIARLQMDADSLSLLAGPDTVRRSHVPRRATPTRVATRQRFGLTAQLRCPCRLRRSWR